ncbi:hypothetical protein [Rhizobium sp. Root708]|uniref:hypothetical protein n=1 Tax=Rhizobium sp. Root708 TaxID=1736592 RepID=UPI000B1E8407|nr:hypothetical protein [Rhizobium sp. Root708]
MSDLIDRFFELQDEDTKVMFVENRGDELTDILVAALEDTFSALSGDVDVKTWH